MPSSPNITMRIEPHVLSRIDQAARILGKSRSAFMIELALKEAESILPNLDQTQFELESVDFNKVMSILEQTPDNTKLTKLLEQQGLPWGAS